MRALVLATSALLLPLVALAATPAPMPAKVSVTFPNDPFAFKPGPGSQAALANCLTCHSSAYVSTQPPLTRAQWTGEVTKMRNVFGAPISDADAATIVDYLTANYGKAP
jgi:sulfite dehydrogenase (cytochrome) subunit B